MPVPLEAKEIAVGDYSYEYGTVKQVKKHFLGDDKVEITFENGTVITPDDTMELEIEQGGRFRG